MEKNEFVSRLEGILPAQELVFPPTPGFGPYRKIMPSEAVAHPAKFNTLLVEFLIKTFTREGDVILDPMAGTGLTGVIASLHGRNAIQVEIEPKFYKWMEKARENAEKATTLTQKGWIKNICGDARKLSELLSQADAIITSPPYSDSISRQGGDAKVVRVGTSTLTAREYSSNPENIGNLPLGNVDTIITSPPYSDSAIQDYGTSNKALLEFEKQVRESFRKLGYFEYKGKRYTEEEWRRINKGELKPRGMPELWAEIVRQRDETRYNSGNPENIGNMPLGDVDAIITSPPYAETKPFHDLDFMLKTARDQSERVRKREIKGHYMTEERDKKKSFEKAKEGVVGIRDNIGNLPLGSPSNLDDREYETLARKLMKDGKPTYLSEMLKVYRECYKVLKPSGLAIVVVKPFIRNKRVIDLPYYTYLLMSRCGFRLERLYKLRLQNLSFWRTLYQKKFPNVPRIAHEYVIVARKMGEGDE